ncbi:hypothetical protein EBZ80_18420 [bacterium]|nr:hypothetical protein [Betaproteobacteria bacterium]NDE16902.1 hypothetical protein [bacterium]
MFHDDTPSSNTPEEDLANNRNNLEYDILTTDWLCDKVTKSEDYAIRLYGTLCNNGFQHKDAMPDEYWTCSWRYAGGIVASVTGRGDYLTYYCSGNEGIIDPEVREDLLKLNWCVVDGFYANRKQRG